MNLTVLFNVFLLLGLSLAEITSSEDLDVAQLHSEIILQGLPKGVGARRFARNAFQNLAQKYIPALEKLIISSCNETGSSTESEKLQATFDEMKECLKKRRIYFTPRNEYIAHIEECSREAKQNTINCLPENQKYFPEFLLHLAEAQVNFLYDDYDIVRDEMVPCLKKINHNMVLTNYIQCIKGNKSDVILVRHQIPSSKTEFCKTFVSKAYCFTNMIKENCDRTPGLLKYREDYIKSHKDVCEE